MELGAEVAEALRRSGVVWLRSDGRDLLVWHVWHEGAVWLVGGPGEQDLGDAAGRGQVEVLVRDPESRALAGAVLADVERVLPGTPAWEAGVPRLHAARLNGADVAGQQERWARAGVVLRLTPTAR